MSRERTAVGSYVTEPVLELRVGAYITLTNTTMRVWTGVGTLVVGNTHFDGVGNLGTVEKVSESGETFASQVKLTLTAVESAPLNEAITESLFGKPVVLYRLWLRDGLIVDTPARWFRGRMGDVNVHRGDPERGNYIETTLHTMSDRARQPTYYTQEDLWMTYSGDTFFKFTSQIQGQKALWGQKVTFFGNPYPHVSGYTPRGRDVLNRGG